MVNEELKHAIGSYTLFHRPTGKLYFGSSRDILNRIRNHRCKLQKGSHGNKNLQGVFTTWEDIVVHVTYWETIEQALDHEQEQIDLYGAGDKCLNIAINARMHSTGMPYFLNKSHSEETKRKISIGNLGKKYSAEARAKIAEARKRKVSIDGVEYPSLQAAAKAIAISYEAMKYRITRGKENYPNYKYV